MAHVMRGMHVIQLDVMPRERLVVDLATTNRPAGIIKVPSIMILVTNIKPAGTIKVPSIEDVVITGMPAVKIKVILKQDLTSVAAENCDGHIVDPFIGVVVMRRKLRERPTDVIGQCTKSSVRKVIVKEI